MGHHYSELESIVQGQEYAVKPVHQIILGHENGSLSRVGMAEEPKQPGQDATKLHHLTREVMDGVFIDPKPGMVHQYMGSMIMLHLHSHWG